MLAEYERCAHSLCAPAVAPNTDRTPMNIATESEETDMSAGRILFAYTKTCIQNICVYQQLNYGQDGSGIESRLGARFYTPIQTGPGAHPASYKMGTGSF
jgi:hypothetical protein